MHNFSSQYNVILPSFWAYALRRNCTFAYVRAYFKIAQSLFGVARQYVALSVWTVRKSYLITLPSGVGFGELCKQRGRREQPKWFVEGFSSEWVSRRGVYNSLFPLYTFAGVWEDSLLKEYLENGRWEREWGLLGIRRLNNECGDENRFPRSEIRRKTQWEKLQKSASGFINMNTACESIPCTELKIIFHGRNLNVFS